MARRAARRFGFGANLRIRRGGEFERLLREGRRKTADGFTFFLLPRGNGGPRLGLLVSRRHSTLATERNRLKRCIREAFRLEQGSIGAVDVLVRPAYGAQAGAAMTARLRPLFARMAR